MSTISSTESVDSIDDVSIDFEPSAPAVTSESWFRRHREALSGIGFSLSMVIVSRLLATFAVYCGTRVFPGKTLPQAFNSWDAGWFFGTVLHGYPHTVFNPAIPATAQNNIAFFPLFPLAVRLVHNILPFTTILQSGIIVSVSTGAFATVMIWFIARDLTKSASTANRSVALFCFFPASIAMMIMLSEGVMLAFATACMYALMKKKWLIAGVCAAMATAARPNALVLCVCCAWACAVALWKDRDWKSLIAPVLSPAGIAAYFVFLHHRTGDWNAWSDVEHRGWGYGKISHLLIFKSFKVLFTHPLVDLNSSATAVALIVAVIGIVWLFKWHPRVDMMLYSFGICFLAFEAGGTASKLRYVWTAFPLAIAAARWAKTELRFSLLLSTSALCLGMFACVGLLTGLMIL